MLRARRVRDERVRHEVHHAGHRVSGEGGGPHRPDVCPGAGREAGAGVHQPGQLQLQPLRLRGHGGPHPVRPGGGLLAAGPVREAALPSDRDGAAERRGGLCALRVPAHGAAGGAPRAPSAGRVHVALPTAAEPGAVGEDGQRPGAGAPPAGLLGEGRHQRTADARGPWGVPEAHLLQGVRPPGLFHSQRPVGARAPGQLGASPGHDLVLAADAAADVSDRQIRAGLHPVLLALRGKAFGAEARGGPGQIAARAVPHARAADHGSESAHRPGLLGGEAVRGGDDAPPLRRARAAAEPGCLGGAALRAGDLPRASHHGRGRGRRGGD
mmetsp:Transcript_9357/g.26260  ORF Transcript_9357/g.26260 Transcript_9357/m.26260 type:complete len:326 (+) Transcript_9357:1461-2438(+)